MQTLTQQTPLGPNTEILPSPVTVNHSINQIKNRTWVYKIFNYSLVLTTIKQVDALSYMQDFLLSPFPITYSKD